MNHRHNIDNDYCFLLGVYMGEMRFLGNRAIIRQFGLRRPRTHRVSVCPLGGRGRIVVDITPARIHATVEGDTDAMYVAFTTGAALSGYLALDADTILAHVATLVAVLPQIFPQGTSPFALHHA